MARIMSPKPRNQDDYASRRIVPTPRRRPSERASLAFILRAPFFERMRKHFPFPSATFFTRTPRGPRAENVPTTTRSPARVLLFSESARENEKNARDHGKSVRVIRTLAMMFMFDVKGASIWSFFFVKERRKDKKGRRREKVCLSLVFQNDFKNNTNNRTPTTEQREQQTETFFLDVEFAPKPSLFEEEEEDTHRL